MDKQTDFVDRNSDLINPCTDDFLKYVQQALKAQGFVRKTSRHSALYNWEFTKGPRRVSITGWHGTGAGVRNFGSMKTLFTITDSHPQQGFKPVRMVSTIFGIMVDFPPSGKTIAQYKEHLDAATKYIRAVC